MWANSIWILLLVIADKDGAEFKDINDLPLYFIWCNSLESRIHIEGFISRRLEYFKPLRGEEGMTYDWVAKSFWFTLQNHMFDK